MSRDYYIAIISDINTASGDAVITVYKGGSDDTIFFDGVVNINELDGIDLRGGGSVVAVLTEFSASEDDGWLTDVQFVIADEFRDMKFVKTSPGSEAFYRTLVVMYRDEEERNQMIDEYCAVQTEYDEQEFSIVEEHQESVSLVIKRVTGADAYECLGVGDEHWISALIDNGKPSLIEIDVGGNG